MLYAPETPAKFILLTTASSCYWSRFDVDMIRDTHLVLLDFDKGLFPLVKLLFIGPKIWFALSVSQTHSRNFAIHFFASPKILFNYSVIVPCDDSQYFSYRTSVSAKTCSQMFSQNVILFRKI